MSGSTKLLRTHYDVVKTNLNHKGNWHFMVVLITCVLYCSVNRKTIRNIQNQIDELDSIGFQQRKILLKWQNIVLEIEIKIKYYEEIKFALVVSKK